MELYQLRTFVKVAQLGHLTRAAKKLNTSQPSVSAHIKALEDEFGVTLFERTKKGMALTLHGTVLFKDAKRVLESCDALINQAQLLKGKIAGEVRIGLNMQSNSLKITQLLECCQSTYPELTLKLLQKSSQEIENDLISGDISCGYLLDSASLPGIDTIHLDFIEFVAAGPVSWKEQLNNTDPNKIVELPWIINTEGCRLTNIIQQQLPVTDKEIKRIVEADGQTMLRLIQAGAGLGFITRQEAETAEKDGLVALWKGIPVRVNLLFAFPKAKSNDPLIDAMIKVHHMIWTI